jgi:hypothetical protein
MSYRDQLKIKIYELEKKIAEDQTQKLSLELELKRLKLAEFEEDLKEEQEKILLKG